MSNEQPTSNIGQVRAEYLYLDRFQVVLDGAALHSLLAILSTAMRAAKEDHDSQRVADITAWSRALSPMAYEAMEAEEDEQ